MNDENISKELDIQINTDNFPFKELFNSNENLKKLLYDVALNLEPNLNGNRIIFHSDFYKKINEINIKIENFEKCLLRNDSRNLERYAIVFSKNILRMLEEVESREFQKAVILDLVNRNGSVHLGAEKIVDRLENLGRAVYLDTLIEKYDEMKNHVNDILLEHLVSEFEENRDDYFKSDLNKPSKKPVLEAKEFHELFNKNGKEIETVIEKQEIPLDDKVYWSELFYYCLSNKLLATKNNSIIFRTINKKFRTNLTKQDFTKFSKLKSEAHNANKDLDFTYLDRYIN